MGMGMFVYLSQWFAPGQWVIDCEDHGVSLHSGLFSDAIGRAFMHKAAHS